MKMYLAGTYSRPYAPIEYMKLFLAGNYPGKGKGNFAPLLEKANELYILESFFYIKDAGWCKTVLPIIKDLLLDSGAFTFMSDKSQTANWTRYVDEYAEFILAHNIQNFFELDIDSVVGLAEVEKLRARLETRVGRQSIPVWHRARGKNRWLSMCKDYSYVSIGGIVSGEIKPKEFPVFRWFLETAAEHGSKVHSLGFTGYDDLHTYPFYSVDSTAWLYGNRGGFLYRFNGRAMDKTYPPENCRMKSRETAIHNFNEWVKFMRYADKHL